MGKCAEAPDGATVQAQPIAGSLTFQRLATILSYAFFAVTVLLWLGLAIPHLRRYKAPNEQRPIFRIISTPLVFSGLALGAVHAYAAAPYLEPIADLYEAYALASLFLLYVHYVVPDVHNRDEFFRNLQARSKAGDPVPQGSLHWFRRKWRIVFMFVLIYTILIIVQEILQATGHACSTTSRGKRGRIILTVLEFIAIITALLAILRFQRRTRDYMKGRRAMMKLISFKLLVLIQVIQRFVFNIVSTQTGGGSKLTYADIATGIPSLLTSFESLVFTIGFYFAFHSREYIEGKGQQPTNYSALRALLHALNPSDLIRGVGLALTSFGKSNRLTQERVADMENQAPKPI